MNFFRGIRGCPLTRRLVKSVFGNPNTFLAICDIQLSLPKYSIVFCLRFKAVDFALFFSFITSAKIFLSCPVWTNSDFLPCSGIEKSPTVVHSRAMFSRSVQACSITPITHFLFLTSSSLSTKGKTLFFLTFSFSLNNRLFHFLPLSCEFLTIHNIITVRIFFNATIGKRRAL